MKIFNVFTSFLFMPIALQMRGIASADLQKQIQSNEIQFDRFRFVTSESELPEILQGKSDALALIKVYPFKNRNKFLQCTGLHVGNGYILTAGHCFLGSLDCNSAKISFGIPDNNKNPSNLRATCTNIVFNEAAGSAYNNSRNDVAIFRVDQYPDIFFNLEASSKDARLGDPLLMVGFPRLDKPRNTDALAVSTGCSFTKLEGSDVFNRPRAQASVLHNCPAVPGMNGAILFNSETLDLVALQQAGSIEPQNGYNPQTLTAVNNVAESLTRLAPVQNFSPFKIFKASSLKIFPGSIEPQATHRISEPTEVRIGSHLAEVFPLGLAEPLNLNAGTFEASEQGASTLRISIQTGAKTTVTLKDGAGQTHSYVGHTFFETTRERAYPAPVTISVSTSKNSKSFFARIQIKPN